MATIPDIRTVKQNAGMLRTGESFMTPEFIDYLFSINIDGKSIVKDNNEGKFELIELSYLIKQEGEETIRQLIETNKHLPLGQIIRKSNVFLKARRRFFLDTTVN